MRHNQKEVPRSSSDDGDPDYTPVLPPSPRRARPIEQVTRHLEQEVQPERRLHTIHLSCRPTKKNKAEPQNVSMHRNSPDRNGREAVGASPTSSLQHVQEKPESSRRKNQQRDTVEVATPPTWTVRKNLSGARLPGRESRPTEVHPILQPTRLNSAPVQDKSLAVRH